MYAAIPEKLVEFKYDSHGLRTQKKVTDHGQTLVAEYICNRKLLTGLTCGNDTVYFFYDVQNRTVKMEFNGAVYIYLYNRQRDVTGLLDGANVLVVEYACDAWDKVLSVSASWICL